MGEEVSEESELGKGQIMQCLAGCCKDLVFCETEGPEQRSEVTGCRCPKNHPSCSVA